MHPKKERPRQSREYDPQKDRGWYSMHRGWMDHPVFKNAPFSEREAWEWLISEAAYKEKIIEVAGSPLHLKRGQLCYSIRFMANNWGWDDSRVHRLLAKFKKWEMIETDCEAGQTLITICNYDENQHKQTDLETEHESSSRQQRRRGEANSKKENKDKQLNGGSAPRAGAHTEPPEKGTDGEPWRTKLKEQLGDKVYQSWIADLSLDEEGCLWASNAFMAGRCKRDYEENIKDALKLNGIEFAGFKTIENKENAA